MVDKSIIININKKTMNGSLNRKRDSEAINQSLTDINNTITNQESFFKPQYDGIGFKTGNGINIDNYNYRALPVLGRKDLVYTTRSSVIPLLGAGEFVYIPTLPIQIQVSSTNINDTGGGTGARAINVAGEDSSGNIITEIIVLNGQSPVSSAQLFTAILGFLVVDSGNTSALTPSNAGDIYLSPSGNTTTLGIPNDRAQIMGTMAINTGSGFTGYLTSPPGTDIYISELTISSIIDSNQNSNVILEFFARSVSDLGVPTGWSILARLSTTTSNPVINLHQGAFPSAALNPANRNDVMIVVRREGGVNTIKYDAYLTSILTTPLP